MNFELVSINKVYVRFSFPQVRHLGDRDQLDGLTLRTETETENRDRDREQSVLEKHNKRCSDQNL